MVAVLDEDLYPDGLRQGYGTDACIDLAVAKDSFPLRPFEVYSAPLGIRVDVPLGHVGWIVARSSTTKKSILVHQVAIDPGYEGEVHAFLMPMPAAGHEGSVTFYRGEVLVGLCVQPAVPPGANPRKGSARGAGMFDSSRMRTEIMHEVERDLLFGRDRHVAPLEMGS